MFLDRLNGFENFCCIAGPIIGGASESLSGCFSGSSESSETEKGEKPSAGSASILSGNNTDEHFRLEMGPLTSMGPRLDLVTGKIEMGLQGGFNPRIQF